jgi:hypothetical protein
MRGLTRRDALTTFVPSLAHVEKNGTAYRYVPVPWNPTI